MKNSFTVLGISAFYHDSAAAIIRDKEIIAAAQEERFTRIKFDSSFPRNSIDYCLREAKIKLSDVDEIIFYENSHLKFDRVLLNYVEYLPKSFLELIKALYLWFTEKLNLEKNIAKELEWKKPIRKIPHHLSHAASAFYPSGFKDAAILVLDGVGEWSSTSIGYGKGNKIELLKEIHFPHSLGMFYSAFTEFCGFNVNADEYKLMGLAPYGDPKYKQLILDKIINVKEDGSHKLNLNYFKFHYGDTTINKKFEKLFGFKKRKNNEQIREIDMDLAASAQSVLDDIFIKLAKTAKRLTNSENIVIAGGVGLNCVSNGKLAESKIFKNVWVQPAAGDAGGALGCALYLAHDQDKKTNNVSKQKGSFLGPSYSNKVIKNYLENIKIKYLEFQDDETLLDEVTNLLTKEKIVGIFNGRMEFGPRALGARSIVADPRSEKMQKNMNLKIKYRESFRPFAPAILEENVSEYFKMDFGNSFMSFVFPINNKIKVAAKNSEKEIKKQLTQKRSTLPAVTHVDYTARIQTVNYETNPFFFKIIKNFYKKTNCPALINTSFNVRNEPIVCNYIDALKCFFSNDMDALVLNKYLILKQKQNLEELGRIFLNLSHILK